MARGSREIQLTGYLLSRYKVNTAIILSAIIFGIFHGSGFFSAFFGGVYLAVVYMIFQNIFACIMAHSMANIFVLFAPKLVANFIPYSLQQVNESPFIALSIIPPVLVLTFFVVFIAVFWDKRKNHPFSYKKKYWRKNTR
ncbi:MAG: CPBP family intramembrane metalloprotease [Xanthomonadales bacterium]|nr:CPBP family intramembrane metalloprotease [Xanthomonadales bacterium]